MAPQSYYNNQTVSLHCYIEQPEVHVQNMTKPKKSVSFSPCVQFQEVLHVNDFTDKEIEASWYERSDYQMMKTENLLTINAIVSGMFQGDDTTYCRRGLESQTPEGARRRMANRANAYAAVLEEQAYQFEEGVEQPEFIARVYSVESNHCQALANAIALEDEMASQR